MSIEGLDTLALVEACYDAWAASDIDYIIDKLSPDSVYQIHAPRDVLHFAGRHEGRAAIRACLETIKRDFDFLAFAVDAINGGSSTARARIVFYYKDPDTNSQLDGCMRHVWRIENGKVVHIDEFHDVARHRAFLTMVKSLLRR